MPVVPSALTHNPLLHRATPSPQRERGREKEVLILPHSYLHKDIKETEGEQSGAPGFMPQYAPFLRLLNDFHPPDPSSPVSPSTHPPLPSKQTAAVPGVLSEQRACTTARGWICLKWQIA